MNYITKSRFINPIGLKNTLQWPSDINNNLKTNELYKQLSLDLPRCHQYCGNISYIAYGSWKSRIKYVLNRGDNWEYWQGEILIL